MIVPLAVLGLVLPNFTSSPGGTLSALHEGFLMLMSVALYGIFLAIQTLRHRHYFLAGDEIEEKAPPVTDLRPAAYHGTLLLLSTSCRSCCCRRRSRCRSTTPSAC